MKKHYFFILFPIFLFSLVFAQNPNQWNCINTLMSVQDIGFEGDYVWASTQGGMLRYSKTDGVCEYFNQGNSGLYYNFCNNFSIDKEKNVWTYCHLHSTNRFKNGEWTNFQDTINDQFSNAYNLKMVMNDSFVWSTRIRLLGSPSFPTAIQYYLLRHEKSNFPVIKDSIKLAKSGNLFSIAADKQGNIWACVDSGFYKYDYSINSWDTLSLNGPFQYVFADDSLNCVYLIKNPNKLYRYDTNGFTQIPTLGSPTANLYFMQKDAFQRYWFKGSVAFYCYDGNNFTTYPLSFFPINVNAINVDSTNHIWVAGAKDTLFEYNGSIWIPHDIDNGTHLLNNEFNSLSINALNEIWANSPNLVYKLNGISANYIKQLNTYSPFTCAVDSNNNYWVTNYGNSMFPVPPINRYDGQNWISYNLPNSEITAFCITITPNNIPYIGTGENGIMYFDGINWQKILPNFPWIQKAIRYVCCDHNNNIYFTDGNGNIGVYNGTTISYILNVMAGSGSPVPELYVDNNNHVWALFINYLRKYNGQTWTDYDLSTSLNVFNSMSQDNNGFYWFLTNYALIKTDFNTDTTIFRLPGHGLVGYRLVIDHANNKWIAGSNGLFVFNENGVFTSPFAASLHKVSGEIYGDNDQNGIHDLGESGLISQKVFVSPNNTTLYSNINGQYGFYADSGHYQLSFVPYNNDWLVSSDSSSYYTFLDTTDMNGFDFGIHPIVSQDSFGIEILPTQSICLANIPVWLNYKNWGTNTRDGSIYFVTDTALTLLNTTPPFSSQNGDTLFWDFTNLQPLESRSIMLQYQVAGPIWGQPWNGLIFSYRAGLTYLNGSNSIPFCNVTYLDTVSCAYDPNDKSCKTYSNIGADKSFYGDLLLYKIRFQNTGNAPAQNIVIMDTLDTNLINLNSFEFLGASHPVLVQMQSNGIVQFTFENIMLPDSGANEAGSHGLLAYYVRSVANAPSNVSNQLNNSAAIYFDLNPPIITNTTHTYLMFHTDIEEVTKDLSLKITPNPFTSSTKISFENKENSLYQIAIYDLAGKLCYQTATKNDFFEINGENLRQGMYLFHIQGNSHYAGKFIKL